MKLIDRYILKELVQPFFFGIFAFTSIFIGSDVLVNLAQDMMDYGIPVLTALRLFFLQLPQIVVWTFPMAMLLAALLSFGRLSGDHEITALRAGGVSFFRMIVPVLIVGLLVTGLAVFFDNYVVPVSQIQYEEIMHQMKYGEELPQTQRNLRITPIDGSTGKVDFVLIAELFDGRERTLERITYQNYEDGRLVQVIEAKKGVWDNEQWIFKEGVTYTITGDGRVPRTEFSQMNMKNKLAREPGQISRGQRGPEEMRQSELREQIRVLEEEGRDVRELKVDYHQRFAVPFACFIFALVGAPLGLKPNRSGSSIGLGLSIVIIFIYYTMMTVGAALGQAGTLSPWFGAWIQNIIFTVVGFGLVVKENR